MCDPTATRTWIPKQRLGKQRQERHFKDLSGCWPWQQISACTSGRGTGSGTAHLGSLGLSQAMEPWFEVKALTVVSWKAGFLDTLLHWTALLSAQPAPSGMHGWESRTAPLQVAETFSIQTAWRLGAGALLTQAWGFKILCWTNKVLSADLGIDQLGGCLLGTPFLKSSCFLLLYLKQF